MDFEDADRPRFLRIDLSEIAPGRPERAKSARWRGSSPGIDRVGCLSGSALALALLHEHAVARESRAIAQPDDPAPLVLAAGECVRRALPTAARATVASRSPLTGLLAEGQVGSDLARRFSRIADALLVEGSTRVPGSILVLSGESRSDARVELLGFPELVGADPPTIHRTIEEYLGPCAALRTGRAGARGIPFACLAAGGDPPSFIGRGGLGAVLGRLGLTAIAVRSSPVGPDPAHDHSALLRLLAASPRLRARASHGTFEVAKALAAGGHLRRAAGRERVSASEASAWSAGLEGSGRVRKGCEGCPTPCGWVFERGFPGGDARTGGARFGAAFALGPALGLDRPEDALALLAACDATGLDAIETGAVLALLARASDLGRIGGGSRSGGVESQLGRIEDLIERRGDGALLALGSAGMASKLGLEGEARTVQGQGARADASLAALLGQSVGARGADPMRTLPFLLSDAPPGRLRELLAPLPLPPGAEHPHDPAAKGRIVWWHENLMAAIDASGFCAFSAAGLLADGVASLDELAEILSPSCLAPRTGRALLVAGASIVAVAGDLCRRYGGGGRRPFPEWARPSLELPGMWGEYASLRGLDEDGGPSAVAWSRLGKEAILEIGAESGIFERDRAASGPIASGATEVARAPGCVYLRCSGPLARALGARSREDVVEIELDLPASLAAVLAAAATEHPRAARHLIRAGELVPAAFRDSRRLLEDDFVEDGEELDLVVALSGGCFLS